MLSLGLLLEKGIEDSAWSSTTLNATWGKETNVINQ